MNINELQPKQGSVEITAEVVEKGDVREFEKFGKKGRVCNAKVKDATGQISLSLWNEQIDQVNVGDKIKISNGYVNEWQGEPQLTTGKFGTLEVVGSSEAAARPAPEESPAEEAAPEPAPETASESASGPEESPDKSAEPEPETDSDLDIEEEKVE